MFNAHWLTYFDEALDPLLRVARLRARRRFFREFDVMVVKAVLEWQGPAGFDDDVAIAVTPVRIGTKSFDLATRRRSTGRPACSAPSPTYR